MADTPPDLTPEDKALVDNLSLFDMLALWRRAPIGTFVRGEPKTEYFLAVLNERREADPAGWTRASKAIGWGP